VSNFYVGQKVVCVDATETTGLEKGRVYTVMSPRRHCACDMQGCVGIDAIGNARHCDGSFCNVWTARRFRPVHENKTDIEIFRRLVEPSALEKFKERVDA